jgi:hypothetical protein
MGKVQRPTLYQGVECKSIRNGRRGSYRLPIRHITQSNTKRNNEGRRYGLVYIERCSVARNGAGNSFRLLLNNTFDGDTCSCNILYSDEALLEAFVNTNSLKSYVTPSGGLINSANTDTVARILFNMTGHKLA